MPLSHFVDPHATATANVKYAGSTSMRIALIYVDVVDSSGKNLHVDVIMK